MNRIDNILEVSDLHTSFFSRAGQVKAVNGVSFIVRCGEVLGIVGESGSGKSTTALSVMRLLPHNADIAKGRIVFAGKDLVNLPDPEMRRIRGKEISMIFQDPFSSLNPVLTIGAQLTEPLLFHERLSPKAARARACEMLSQVGISHPEKRMSQYPHEFSGGMRQRAMIAMALSCQPKLLIADEPTAALDVTVQSQILELLKNLLEKSASSIVLITHDLAVVAEICSRIIVMYAGIIVEQGSTREIFYKARHPYTWGLLSSIPSPRWDRGEPLAYIPGQPPDMLEPPTGCPFWPRCKYAMIICREERPPSTELSLSHQVTCWLLHPGAPPVERGVPGS